MRLLFGREGIGGVVRWRGLSSHCRLLVVMMEGVGRNLLLLVVEGSRG